MRYSSLWPTEPTKQPFVTGLPKSLDREHGIDYGQPQRDTTVSNVSLNKTVTQMKPTDKRVKLPKGL